MEGLRRATDGTEEPKGVRDDAGKGDEGSLGAIRSEFLDIEQ